MLATARGEGGAVFSVIKDRFHRPPPFLRRNVRKALRYLTMGSTFSVIKDAAIGMRQRDELLVSDDEDDDARPSKRRRIDPPDDEDETGFWSRERSTVRNPLNHVTNESTRRSQQSTKMESVPPSSFYGKPNLNAAPLREVRRSESLPTRKKNFLEIIASHQPTAFLKSLRVDLTGILSTSYESPNIFWNGQQSFDIECKCSAALFCAKNDEGSRNIVRRPQDYTELCRIKKTGILRFTSCDDGSVTRDLIFEPFVFSSEEILVNRRKSKHIFQDFADSYNVQITLEPRGFHQYWPPLALSSFSLQETTAAYEGGQKDLGVVSKALLEGSATANEIFLSCKTLVLVDPQRQCKAVNLSICHKGLKQASSYALKLRIRWAVPNYILALPTPPIFEPPRRSKAEPDSNENLLASQLAKRSGDVSMPTSPVDSRARRVRGEPIQYNLKVLSAQAQGKSPRKRKAREMRPKMEQAADDVDDLSISYCFGRADSADNGIRQQHTFTGLNCPFCGANHKYLEELRLHLHGEHHNYKFHLRRSKPRINFFVEVVKNHSCPSSTSERMRTLQMGSPRTLFDLEKFLGGDETWMKAREGPLHMPDHVVDHGQESSLSSSPHGSRYSSPNTSHSMDDLLDQDKPETKLSVRPRKIFHVPRTNKPLYDTITKRVLEPGEEIPSSDDEKDGSWFHQKHRDIINDFEDITVEEKDYITQWNPFIVDEQLTSEQFLPEAILKFVETKKGWFARRNTRKAQFLKHMETFVLRGVVSEDLMHKCLGILRAEEKKNRAPVDSGADGEVREVSPSKHRGVLDCICCEHTQLHDRIVCRGPRCKGRFFHRQCAQDFGRPIHGRWTCDSCLFSDSSS